MHQARAALALFAALAFLTPPAASADPGVGAWVCVDGTAADMNGKNHTCTYIFTAIVDSTILVADQGPWEFCFDADDTTDVVLTGTVTLRKVTGDADVTNKSEAVNGLTLTGADDARCLYQLGKGRYWVDVIGDPGVPNSTAVFRHM